MHLLERLLREQGRKHLRGYIIAFAMMAVISAATTASALTLKYIVDRILVDKNFQAMWIIGAAIMVIYAAKGLATYGNLVTLSKISNNIIADIQTRIFEKMLAMDVSFYNARHSTEFIARQAFSGNRRAAR